MSAIAGALFVPYAFSKGYLTTVIIVERWHFVGLSPIQTAQLFHVLEGIPLVFMLFGLVSLRARTVTRGSPANAGVAVALVGFGLTILSHLGEHLLAPVTVPVLTGSENWFMWGYYLSWLTVYAGLSLYGLGLVRTDGLPGWLPWVFVSLLPASVAVGLVVTALDVFTVAGTFRVIQGLLWVFVGYWLSVESRETPLSRRTDLVASHGTDDR